MNDTQAIFTVFFAIVWGTSANAWPRRRPFNWGFSYDDRIWNRAWLSVSMLNVAPVSFFIGALWLLGGDRVPVHFQALAGIVPAFAMFGMYRLWLGTIELNPDRYYYRTAERPPGLESEEQTIEQLHPDPRPRANLVAGLWYMFIGIIPLILVAINPLLLKLAGVFAPDVTTPGPS